MLAARADLLVWLDLPIVRLTRQREVDRWVQRIEQLAAQRQRAG